MNCQIFYNYFTLYLLLAGESLTEEDQQLRRRYEEWMSQQDMWFGAQISQLEQQVAKFRRTKKSLNAKQRVVS